MVFVEAYLALYSKPPFGRSLAPRGSAQATATRNRETRQQICCTFVAREIFRQSLPTAVCRSNKHAPSARIPRYAHYLVRGFARNKRAPRAYIDSVFPGSTSRLPFASASLLFRHRVSLEAPARPFVWERATLRSRDRNLDLNPAVTGFAEFFRKETGLPTNSRSTDFRSITHTSHFLPSEYSRGRTVEHTDAASTAQTSMIIFI